MLKLFYSLLLSVLLVVGVFAQEDTDTDDECCDGVFESFDLDGLVDALAENLSLSDDLKAEFLEEAGRRIQEMEENPDARFANGLKTIEEFVPALSGVSTTWEVTEKPKLFSKLTSELAKHHELNDKNVERLIDATEQLIQAVPEDQQSLLHSDMNLFSRLLVGYTDLMHRSISDVHSDAEDVRKMKESMLELDPDADVGFADRFQSCADRLTDKNNTEFSKLFSSVTDKMIRATVSIKKMESTDEDFSREIFRTISDTFTPYVQRFSKLRRTVLATNCYKEIDSKSLMAKLKEFSISEE